MPLGHIDIRVVYLFLYLSGKKKKKSEVWMFAVLSFIFPLKGKIKLYVSRLEMLPVIYFMLKLLKIIRQNVAGALNSLYLNFQIK